MIRLFTKQIERLGSEEGQALVFVAMVGLVIFLFLAMSMNMAELINTKIKNQNVADATALSGAVWQARALNMIAGANQNIITWWMLYYIDNSVVILTTLFFGMMFCNVENPLEIPLCIFILAFAAGLFLAALAFLGAAFLTGDLQGNLSSVINRDLLEQELNEKENNIVDMNYSYKENTSFEFKDLPDENYNYTGMMLFLNDVGGDIFDGVFRRAGFCELVTTMAYYIFRMGIISPIDWNNLKPLIEDFYTNGFCNPGADPLQIFQDVPGIQEILKTLPLMLNTVAIDGTTQNIEELLPITVGTFRDRYTPAILGTGTDDPTDPDNCRTQPSELVDGYRTTFDCPVTRHYNFASAHAFSESVNYFYHTAVAGLSTPYPIPLIPFEMDWAPRLFPIEPYPVINPIAPDWHNNWNDRGWEPPHNQLPVAGESPLGGWNAYCGAAGNCLGGTLLNQVRILFGSPSEETILKQNTLDLHNSPYFLY